MNEIKIDPRANRTAVLEALLQALDLLVDAIPSVAARCPEARFVLVGGTKPEIEALAAQATRLGVRERLILVEHRPQAEMPAFLAAVTKSSSIG